MWEVSYEKAGIYFNRIINRCCYHWHIGCDCCPQFFKRPNSGKGFTLFCRHESIGHRSPNESNRPWSVVDRLVG